MAEVPAVELLEKVTPVAREVTVVGRIRQPLAVVSDSHLGGTATGSRFLYGDVMQFVWWTGADNPTMPFTRSFSNAFSSAFR